MADSKISALPASTTPLAGTEVLPIVQGGATKQVSVANLTSGRAVSALSVTSSTIGAGSGSGLSLQSNASTNVTLDISGNLGIGTSSPNIIGYTTGATVVTLKSTANNQRSAIELYNYSAGITSALGSVDFGNGTSRLSQISGACDGATDSANIRFLTTASGGSLTERMRVDSSGNLLVGTTSSPSGSGNIVPAAAKGVNFTANTPAAGMTSQLLNWYEEITAASTACTGAITTAVSWKLTRVGNLVTLTLPPVTGAATSSINFEFGVLIPSGYRPPSSLMFPCGVRDNDANQSTAGMCIITSAGNIRVYLNIAASANFTANASATACGFAQGCGFSCSWRL